uniref:Uncharacterized protein n=1 Tax=Arundo donax TaxID=35708 RepID=A0A0A8Z301_ARUDO
MQKLDFRVIYNFLVIHVCRKNGSDNTNIQNNNTALKNRVQKP